ncbi:uncharacterized protein CLUP02_12952 [Colletotrichum lupini]|uniref:Uncharacterized protein n=1 Tax=Colletotrichum lupini TaxID=145971 RepID=A0A9Q8T1J1_9PEZI|nr:uncharacterized protein CLUP02_12952 [Colletotrichum lupini]UQC87447.1 hypothetical protein CLUP02_12952 [Colletotrichum lupini]
MTQPHKGCTKRDEDSDSEGLEFSDARQLGALFDKVSPRHPRCSTSPSLTARGARALRTHTRTPSWGVPEPLDQWTLPAMRTFNRGASMVISNITRARGQRIGIDSQAVHGGVPLDNQQQYEIVGKPPCQTPVSPAPSYVTKGPDNGHDDDYDSDA